MSVPFNENPSLSTIDTWITCVLHEQLLLHGDEPQFLRNFEVFLSMAGQRRIYDFEARKEKAKQDAYWAALIASNSSPRSCSSDSDDASAP